MQILVTLLEPIQTAGSAGCDASVMAAAAAVVDDIISKCKQLGVRIDAASRGRNCTQGCAAQARACIVSKAVGSCTLWNFLQHR